MKLKLLSNWFHEHRSDRRRTLQSPDRKPRENLWAVVKQETGSSDVQLTNRHDGINMEERFQHLL